MVPTSIPAGLELVKTTPEFNEQTAPPELLKTHAVPADAWAKLVVTQGNLEFAFEDETGKALSLASGESIVIPPERPHKVILAGPTLFHVEVYKLSLSE